MSLPYAVGTPRPPNVSVEIVATGAVGTPGATMPVVTGRGVLNSITLNSASPGANVWAFDNATAATGVVLPSNTLGVNLATGVVLNFDVTFYSGLTLLISGTVDCVVSYYLY